MFAGQIDHRTDQAATHENHQAAGRSRGAGVLRVKTHRPGVGDGPGNGGARGTDQHGDQHSGRRQAELPGQPQHHQPRQGDQTQADDDLRAAFQMAMQDAGNNPADHIGRTI
ncbi:hypothetical protein D3C84_605130 [compost metagenome]